MHLKVAGRRKTDIKSFTTLLTDDIFSSPPKTRTPNLCDLTLKRKNNLILDLEKVKANFSPLDHLKVKISRHQMELSRQKNVA